MGFNKETLCHMVMSVTGVQSVACLIESQMFSRVFTLETMSSSMM